MNELRLLLKKIIYGEHTLNEYDNNKKEIIDMNLERFPNLAATSFSFCLILYTTMVLLNGWHPSICHTYLILMLLSLSMLIIYKTFIINNTNLLLFFQYFYMTISFLILGLTDSINHLPEICALFVIVPMFLTDKPNRYSAITLINALVIAIVILGKGTKDAIVSSVECGLFGFISCGYSYMLYGYKMTEITSSKEIKEQRDTDYLTHLKNRGYSEKKISKYLENTDELCVMYLLDLDNFKFVNDNYGHAMGDEVLIEVAKLLTKIFTKADHVARIGGDEFVIFAGNITNQGSAEKKAQRFLSELKANILIDGKPIIGCSIGIAFSTYKESYDSLYAHADEAMYDAKEAGKNQYHVYKNKK